MAREVFVAIFETPAAAEQARRDLEASGIPAMDMDIRSGPDSSAQPGFWARLFGYGHEDESRYYDEHLASGRAILSITAASTEYDRIARVLQGHQLVRTDWEQEPSMAPPADAAAEAPETVIPTAKEELQVGKRQSSDTRSYRIRRYIVERPVEAEVELRDETVSVERRQAAQGTPGDRPFEERTIEVTETREEPVVSKVVKPGEEVVVRKQSQDRTETVRDTVRESKVDVDQAAAANKPGR